MSTELDKARAASADVEHERKARLGPSGVATPGYGLTPKARFVLGAHLKEALAEVDRLAAALAEAEAVRARVAELERLQASIHKAADAARKAERADVVAFLGKQAGSFHATNEIDACATLAGAKMAIQHGAHEGAAGGS